MLGSNFNDLQKFINDLCRLLLFFTQALLRRFNLNTPPPKDFGHVAHPDAEASGSPPGNTNRLGTYSSLSAAGRHFDGYDTDSDWPLCLGPSWSRNGTAFLAHCSADG